MTHGWTLENVAIAWLVGVLLGAATIILGDEMAGWQNGESARADRIYAAHHAQVVLCALDDGERCRKVRDGWTVTDLDHLHERMRQDSEPTPRAHFLSPDADRLRRAEQIIDQAAP